MTREEILKKSREENMGVDVADYEAAKAGIKYGWMVAVVLSCIFVVVDGLLLSRMPVEMLSAVLAGLSTVFFSKYAQMKKRHELIIAILYGVASLCFFISWIIQIIKI